MSNQPLLAKILKYMIYATAFMPLIIFSQYISPFHFGKVTVFRSMVDLIVVFYIVLIIRDKSYLPPLTRLFWAITWFTLAFGLAAFTSINVSQSFFGTLERMGGWLSFLHFWAFFVIASSILRKKEEWLVFIKLSLFVSLLSAFYGFLQKTSVDWIIGSGGRTKIFGTIGNPALFAGYMIVNAFLALMMFARPAGSRLQKNFYLAVFLLDSYAVFLSGVRGSVLAVIIGLAIFGFLYGFSLGSKKVKLAAVSFVILVILGSLGLYSLRNADFVQRSQYFRRYSDISLNSFTVRTRFWAWRAGFDGLNDSFRAMLVGYGPENFNIPFSKHFNPQFFRGPGSETLFDRAHNQFIEVLITMGIVGFIAYLLIFFEAFRGLPRVALGSNPNDVKEAKIFRVGLIAALAAYMIHNSFIFDTSANYLVFFLVLGFINHFSVKPLPQTRSQSRQNNLWPALSGIILMILAITLIFYTNIQPARANYTTTRAIVASWAGNHDAAFQKFKEALAFDTFGKYEIRHRYAQYILDYSSNKKIDQKLIERILVAIDNVKKNIPGSPQDYLPYLYVSRAYIVLGKDDPKSPYNDLAIENSSEAVKISPTFVRTYYEVAQAYLNKKDHSNAIEAFKRAVELNPEVGISWWYLGVSQIEAGQKEAGIESIKAALASGFDFSGNKNDILRLINIFASLDDFGRVAEFYQKLINIEPKNPQWRASLASAYAKTGRIDEAVAEARIAAELDASFEPEARSFVENLGRRW